MKVLLIVLVLALGWPAVAQPISERQEEAENHFAMSLGNSFDRYRWTHRDAMPTNWTMVEGGLAEYTMNRTERQFREFGNTRGFTNSIYEKYVFVPSGVKLSGSESPDLLLISAVPLEDPHGAILRWGVWRQGTNLIGSSILENKVQQAFSNAAVTIPVPAPMPSAIQGDPPEVQAEASWQEFRRKHPELFRGGKVQRAEAWEKYIEENRRQNAAEATSNNPVSPEFEISPPVNPASRKALWPLAVFGLAIAIICGLWWRGRKD